MSIIIHLLSITAIVITILDHVNGTLVINGSWNDDFQYTNIGDYSVDSWYNPTINLTDDPGSYTSICEECGGIVWGWWTNQSQSQIAHSFYCMRQSQVHIELKVYFCVETSSDIGQNVFYFWRLADTETNSRLQNVSYNSSWTSIGPSGINKPGTTCNAAIRRIKIVDTFIVTSTDLIKIIIYQQIVQDNAIAFNKFRIRCIETTINSSEPSKEPTKAPQAAIEPTIEPRIDESICGSSKYVGALSAKIYIVHNDYNESNNTNKTVTVNELIEYMTTCKNDIECDIMLDNANDSIIYYNEYISFYCCFDDKNNLDIISLRIESTEFTKCIDDEIDDNTTTLIQDIYIWLKNVHEMYFKFAIPDFMIFLIILIVMMILMILTILNWIHSKTSFCLCCWCSICGCMASDESNLGILFLVSLRISDMITDCLISYNIYRYYLEFEKDNVYIFVLTIINACSLILPYFIINILAMISVSKLNTNTDRLREWFRKYKCRILFVTVITGDFYVSLLLFTSNIFGIDLFDSGLSLYHITKLRKFKIAAIICENIPQMVTQSIFGWYTNDFQIIALSLILSLSVNIGNVIAWFINKNFDKTCIVYDYYIEVKIQQTETFKFRDDLAKIKRYRKCRKRLKKKLVNIIRENTSNIQCQVYYVEMIGTGCNIHIIHYITENTKIRTSSTGSVPVSDIRKFTDIDGILQIYDGKYEQIEEELKQLWHLKGNVFIYLRLQQEQDTNLPDHSTLQMSLQRRHRVHTHSDIYQF